MIRCRPPNHRYAPPVRLVLSVAHRLRCSASRPARDDYPMVTPASKPPPKIGLALGGGAARGFAHIGVIKVLETQGIVPDIIVGTSAGAVVGALYAAGLNGFELQRLALDMKEDMVAGLEPARSWRAQR